MIYLPGKSVKYLKNLAFDEFVYRKTEKSMDSCDNFEWEGRLSEDNRWVMMAKLIPWLENELFCLFRAADTRGRAELEGQLGFEYSGGIPQ